MSRSQTVTGVAAVCLCVAAGDAFASQAVSAGGLFTDLGNVSFVGEGSIGDICVGANVGGPAGAAGFAGSNSAGFPAKACSIAPVTAVGFPGVIPGIGFQKVPKTPNQFASGTINAMAMGTSATGHADWTEKNVPGIGPPGVDFKVTGNASANVVGPAAGLAAGQSDDPMFFTLDSPATITLSVILTENALEAVADPGATAAAFLAAEFALGSGDTAGSHLLWSGSASDSLTPGQAFSPHSVTVFEGTLSLAAGSYWLTDRLTSGAVTTAVPEPPESVLIVLGLAALASIRWRWRTGASHQ